MLPIKGDLIAAIATPPGIGGVGIIRISGHKVTLISKKILSNHKKLLPNLAIYSKFLDRHGNIIDEGIAIFFQGPNSFTGENILELQAHGGPIILNILLNRVIELGARIAEPGEFTQRAFLANKIDLIQAESIASLINAETVAAAMAASKSLQGQFSNQINPILNELINLRAYIEAHIDFPEDDLDTMSMSMINHRLEQLIIQTKKTLIEAKNGALLINGLKVTILGKPNVGKSSLLNYLSGKEHAIVTDLPGTTRDLIRNKINLDGLMIEFVDTAGLRVATDLVEQIGVKKALDEIATTDLIILMLDAEEFIKINTTNLSLRQLLPSEILDLKLIKDKKIILLVNKIDLINEKAQKLKHHNLEIILISIIKNDGIELIKECIKELCGNHLNSSQSTFMANARHIQALEQALAYLQAGTELIQANFYSWDLLAEDLRLSQESIGAITGLFSNEDLLGKIFSEFCIGK